ncbi:MAG: YfhO family protein [Patescibacteria group bacterium]
MVSIKKLVQLCWPLGLLLLAFISINSDIFFAGRTLLPIAPSYTVLPNVPSGYQGPVSHGFTSIDPAGTLNVSYAFDALTQTALAQGHLPLWNPYQGLGQPFLSNGISSVLSPFTWLASLISPAFWDLVYLLPWLVAAVCVYAYVRLWKLDRGASVVGAATVFASGLIQLYAMLREYGGVIAWMPLLLYATERTLREPDWRWRHATLAVGIFGLISAGQPEVYLIAVVAILLYAIIRLVAYRKNLRQLIRALLPGVLGGSLLALPALISFSLYAFDAFSLHDPSRNVGLEHLPFHTILSYLFPFLYGRTDLSVLEAGWFPFLGIFFAVSAVSFKRRLPAAGWLALAAGLLMAAKIWGDPLINLVGDLPLFDRIQFPKYASFILTFSLATLAAFGLHAVAQLPAKAWRNRLFGWVAGVVVLWGVSVWTVWEKVDFQHLLSTEAGLYGVVGGVWAIVLPGGLWWFKQHKPDEKELFYTLAGAGVGLQGIAYALNGYQLSTYANLSLVCLLLFVGLVVAFKQANIPSQGVAVGLTLVALAAVPLVTAFTAENGQPARYNPLTSATYLERLKELQAGGLYRSYSFDGTPQPNFAAPFEISNLGVVEALVNTSTASFFTTYLDRTISPIWFAGNYSWNRTPGTAMTEYQENKRFFDLVGVKYVVNVGTEYAVVQYDTESVDQNRIPINLDIPLESTFNAPSDHLSQIQVLLSTYGKVNPGVVTASLLNSKGTVLYKGTANGALVVDNGLQNFYPDIQTTPGEALRLHLEFSPSAAGSMLAVWRYPAHPELGFSFRVVDTPYSVVFVDEKNRIYISENADALPRVFLAIQASVEPKWEQALDQLKGISDLDKTVVINQGGSMASDWPPEQAVGEVEAFTLEPNEVSFTYSAQTAGILVLTDAYDEGWEAEVNGKPAEVLQVDGVFRGVRIDQAGEYTVRFWYRPAYWNINLLLAGAGLVLVVSLTTASFFPRRVAK